MYTETNCTIRKMSGIIEDLTSIHTLTVWVAEVEMKRSHCTLFRDNLRYY